MPDGDKLLVVTGRPGSGKSHLLRRLEAIAGARVFIFDGLQEAAPEFRSPEPAPEIFAIDAADFIRDAAGFCAAAHNWATSTGTTLVLVAFSVAGLRGLGVTMPDGMVEVELTGRRGDGDVIVRYRGAERRLSGDEFAKGIADALAGSAGETDEVATANRGPHS